MRAHSISQKPGAGEMEIFFNSRPGTGMLCNMIKQQWRMAAMAMALPTLAGGLSAAPVLNGIDVLARDGFAALDGQRIGLITNASGHDRARTPTIDLLHRAENVELAVLFGPEHGLRADLDQEKIPDGKDEATGLVIHSLYGERRAPSPAQLAGLDALVFDVQDAGCRFYTYLSTLVMAMEAAAPAGVRVVVLDRVNPIGPRVEGPVLSEARSFVGIHEVPLRHGMTLGELATLIRAERVPEVDLLVIRCEGNPLQWFDATGQPWTPPSPNLRTPAQALLYPGVAILEFCRVSVGRGTDTPFELIGAPWIACDVALAQNLNAAGLAGVTFTPIRFTPKSSVFAGELCRGVRFTVTDREAFRPLDLGLVLARTLHEENPGALRLGEALRLLGDAPTLEAIRAGKPAGEIRSMWQPALDAFDARRTPHLLYPR